MDIDSLFELDRLAVRTVASLEKRRFVWDTLRAMPGRPFVALVGPRGSGKTVLLRQLRTDSDAALYLSADSLERDTDLFSLVQTLSESYGVKQFFIDEIHFVRDFAGHLKQIYDFLPVHLVCTSSVALALTASAWDLARRVVTVPLQPFSYREYLWFAGHPVMEPLLLAQVCGRPVPVEYLRLGGRFADYLGGGLYPFTLEPGAGRELFASILQKVITGDIPSVHPDISMDEIELLRKVVRFIGRSGVDGINYSSVAKNVGITKYKSEQYLTWLEDSFVVHRIMPRGSNVLKEPKVLLQLPYRLLYQEYGQAIGALREEFFVLAMRHHGVEIDYLKSTRGAKTPDYILSCDGEQTVVEIGGKGKGRTQFKDVTYDRKIVLYDADADADAGTRSPLPGQRLPLFLVGFA
ncbi:MAG: AAA family ATPase [Spirochaeta sp.]|jgi:predicted AAA+ superfamily ATPase|nr:AAA family ATPase [Spirochaeta sp.]